MASATAPGFGFTMDPQLMQRSQELLMDKVRGGTNHQPYMMPAPPTQTQLDLMRFASSIAQPPSMNFPPLQTQPRQPGQLPPQTQPGMMPNPFAPAPPPSQLGSMPIPFLPAPQQATAQQFAQTQPLQQHQQQQQQQQQPAPLQPPLQFQAPLLQAPQQQQ